MSESVQLINCAWCGESIEKAANARYIVEDTEMYFCGYTHLNKYVSLRKLVSEDRAAMSVPPSTEIYESARKADDGKLPLDLLDPAALEGIAAVLAFGAKKYAPHNWRKGFKWSRLVAAMLRHTFAIMRGEYIDPESGLPHIDHVGCCWMFLSNHMKTKPELNDLWREPVPVGTSDAITGSPSSAS